MMDSSRLVIPGQVLYEAKKIAHSARREFNHDAQDLQEKCPLGLALPRAKSRANCAGGGEAAGGSGRGA
jgi:hypothetical protein